MTSVEPLLSQPNRRLFELAEDVPTPALVYDFPGITASILRMQSDLSLMGAARLNFAVKACHTSAVLSHIAGLGLGADVASVGELDLARKARFDEISATGPAFGPSDFAEFRAAMVVPDIDSADQLRLYGELHRGTEVGLRVRIPLPAQLENEASFGANSRFGVDITDSEVHSIVEEHGLRLTRLHAHTGQMTPESLLYKVRYFLEIAASFPLIRTLDLGGGFFGLYQSRAKAIAACRKTREMVLAWSDKNNRDIELRFEPGGAVLAAYGYLFTTVRSVRDSHSYFGTRVVTVDCSAWNLTPWHKPTVLSANADDRDPETLPGLIAGNTLYELDFFGGPNAIFEFPKCGAGDRLLITAAGAYTMTNSRRFNSIPPPQEYAFDGGSLIPLAPAH